MLGCVYTFEGVGDLASGAVSTTARGILNAAIRGRSQIRFEELTDPGDSRAMFAVFFDGAEDKTFFEALFAPLSAVSGLRVEVVRCLAKGSVAQISDLESEPNFETSKAG